MNILLSVSLIESSMLQGILMLGCLIAYLTEGIGEGVQGLSVSIPRLLCKSGDRMAKDSLLSIFSLKPIIASVLGFVREN